MHAIRRVVCGLSNWLPTLRLCCYVLHTGCLLFQLLFLWRSCISNILFPVECSNPHVTPGSSTSTMSWSPVGLGSRRACVLLHVATSMAIFKIVSTVLRSALTSCRRCIDACMCMQALHMCCMCICMHLMHIVTHVLCIVRHALHMHHACIMCMHCVCIMCAMCVHYTCVTHALHMHCMCVVHMCCVCAPTPGSC